MMRIWSCCALRLLVSVYDAHWTRKPEVVCSVAAKSKSLKKSNAEFLKKQQAMLDSIFEQAEAMKVDGEAHL